MRERISRIEYFAITVGDKPTELGEITKKLAVEDINLLALSVFPLEKGKLQVDFVPERPEDFTRIAKKLNLAIGRPKVAFLIEGEDRKGALSEALVKLGTEKIGIRATYGVCGGNGRYGALIWVAPNDVESAARILGATVMTAHVV
jgi:hypothetical protein